MERGHQLDPLVGVEATAQLGYGELRLQQGLRREGPEGHKQPRLYQGDLTDEVGLTVGDLILFGVAVIGGTAFNDIGDVDVLALHANRLDNSRQQLTGPSNERLPLEIFIPPRRLADKHQLRMRIADTKDDMRSAAM